MVGFYNPLNKTYYLTGRPRGGGEGDFETWVFDHGEKKWSLLETQTPPMTGGAGAYDPYHNVRYLTGQLRNQETTFWTFDLAAPGWTQHSIEAPSALHAHTSNNADFDPEHNALIVFGGWSWAVHAFRYKEVPEGTEAVYGGR